MAGDTAANWSAWNGILANKEMVLETDTKKIKVGDGITVYNSLPYYAATVATANTPNTAPLRDGSGNFAMGKLTSTEIDNSQGQLYNYRPKKVIVSTSTYTLQASDMSCILYLTFSGAQTITIPAGLPTDFHCTIMSRSTGVKTLTTSGGATYHSADGYTNLPATGCLFTLLPTETVNAYEIYGNGAP